jgi:hypothetical protein
VQYPAWSDFNSAVPNSAVPNSAVPNSAVPNITIAEEHDSLSFEIYRKPTTTDIIIPNESCHPREHKAAAIRYFSME